MKLFYCPTCTRVYYLPEDAQYLCGRVHVASAWSDGKLRKMIISERTETNRPPWPIPKVTEERELLNQDIIETWISACENPDDDDYGDVRRHFGYGAPGGKHLTTEEVVNKYGPYVLQLADNRTQAQ